MPESKIADRELKCMVFKEVFKSRVYILYVGVALANKLNNPSQCLRISHLRAILQPLTDRKWHSLGIK